MHRKAALNVVLILVILSSIITMVSAAPVVVSSIEDWNGIQNPHETEGVTLLGSGTPDDPAVYTIPDGLTISAGGAIRLSTDLDNSSDNAAITFIFQRGNLQILEGGYIETCLGNRGDNRMFVIDMGGGSILGAGRIVGLRQEGPRNRKPRGLSIQKVKDIDLKEIDLHVEDISSEIPDLTIAATGRVRIQGKVDNSDIDSGGNPVNNIRIDAESIEIGSIDTRAFRPSGRRSGSVFLRALSSANDYDAASAQNQYANRVIINGPIRTDGFGDGGNVTISGVVLQVGGMFQITTAKGGIVALNAGLDTLGAPRNDLFIDSAGAGMAGAVKFSVNWNGVVAIGKAPAFASNPVLRSKAVPNTPYSATLVGTASDPDNDKLVFARGNGPAWLSISPEGLISGTPAESNAGMNSWTISVTDGTRVSVAKLIIGVSGRPTFYSNPVLKPSGTQNQPYSNTLADSAADPDNDPITFAKVDGPEWLIIAANGALSGTPPATATATNTWTVSVSDATGTDKAKLLIVISGAPRWLISPVVKAPARAGFDYAAVAETLAVNAVDADGDPIKFEKVSGPAWLQIGANGALSGTPSDADVGMQTWTVKASDATKSSEAVLKIEVIEKTAAIMITTSEVWDGVLNPHAAEGVKLTGTGTVDDPAVYTIPRGMRFTSSGSIQMTQTGTPDNSIKFILAGGNITMDSGAVINLGRRKREELQTFTLDMGGGSILGDGRIIGLLIADDSPRKLTIENAKDVILSEIDLHVVNANNGPRNLDITASGMVSVPRIDIGDRDTGGNPVGSVFVKAQSIFVHSIDVRSMRTGSYRGNGSILLTALGGPNYDPGMAAANNYNNQIVVTGPLLSRGPVPSLTPGLDGNISLQAVAIKLGAGYSTSVPDDSTVTISAGIARNGLSTSDLFMDRSGTATAQNMVEWTGGVNLPGAPILSGVELFASTVMRVKWTTQDLLANEFSIEQSSDGVTFSEAGKVFAGLRYYEIAGLTANKTSYFRVRARNSAGTSAYSNIGSAKTPAWGVNVNFASGTFTTDVPGFPIPGYQNDYGDLYGDRGNGQFFGWSEDNTANARLRSAANSPDARYDTLTHLQRNADMVWEIALTNGDYKVHLVGGDPTATDNTCQYLVEDQLTEAKAPAAGANWMDFNVSCTVSDGKLTIRSGPQAVNNKICFVDIVRSQAEPPAQPPVITLVSQKGGNITIQWTGGGTLQSSASLGSLAVWTDVSAGGSVTVPATGAVRFYRVRQ